MPDVPPAKNILVCHGAYCNLSGRSLMLVKEFRQALAAAGQDGACDVRLSGCMGFCRHAPMVAILPGGMPYHRVHAKDVSEIVNSHVVNHQVCERKVLKFDGSR